MLSFQYFDIYKVTQWVILAVNKIPSILYKYPSMPTSRTLMHISLNIFYYIYFRLPI